MVRAGTLAVLQLVINFLPSTVLNSLILISYGFFKNLRSPFNLLFVCFSGLSLFSHVVLFILVTFAQPIAIAKDECFRYRHFEIKVQNFLVYSLPSLTVTLISAIQSYIIIAGVKKVTYKRVVVAIISVWSYGVCVWLIGTVGYVYNSIDICGSRSANSTITEAHIVRTLFSVLDGLFIDIPCFVVILIMTITSCGCFYRKVNNPSINLLRRMLLLPILMISFFFFTTVLSRSLNILVPLFGLRRLGLSRSFPILGITIRLISQSNSFLFAALFIGLQKKFRKGIVEILRGIKQKISCKSVKVTPTQTNRLYS